MCDTPAYSDYVYNDLSLKRYDTGVMRCVRRVVGHFTYRYCFLGRDHSNTSYGGVWVAGQS